MANVQVIPNVDVVTTVQGVEYDTTGGALDWTIASGAAWPADLTGATITVAIRLPSTNASHSGSVVTPTGASRKVRLALTAAQSAAIPTNEREGWRYTVTATLATKVYLLAKGRWRSQEKP